MAQSAPLQLNDGVIYPYMNRGNLIVHVHTEIVWKIYRIYKSEFVVYLIDCYNFCQRDGLRNCKDKYLHFVFNISLM